MGCAAQGTGRLPVALPPHPPRQPNAPLPHTRKARVYLDECFRLLGGIESFTKWAKENPDAFYPLYVKARVARPLPEPEDSGEERITIVVQASEPRSLPAVSTHPTQAEPQAE